VCLLCLLQLQEVVNTTFPGTESLRKSDFKVFFQLCYLPWGKSGFYSFVVRHLFFVVQDFFASGSMNYDEFVAFLFA
jgi:hypothetical protein